MKKLTQIIGGTVAAFLLAVVLPAASLAGEVVVDINKNGEPVAVEQNDMLTVRLDDNSNPKTHLWKLDQTPNCLAEHSVPGGDDMSIRNDGMREFHFAPEGVCKGDLKFGLYRLSDGARVANLLYHVEARPNSLHLMQGAAREQTVVVGQHVFVSLGESPSTGYSWKVTDRPAELALVSDHYVPGHAPPHFVGTPGMHYFEFVVEAPVGCHLLTFALARPWEKDKAPERSFSFQLCTQNPPPVVR